MTNSVVPSTLRWLLYLAIGITLIAPAHANRFELKLGVINERAGNPELAISRYKPLADYLSTQELEAGQPIDVTLVIADSLEEMVKKFDSGEVDILLEGVLSTSHVQSQTGNIKRSLIAWRKGQRQYHSVFFVKKESPSQVISDLKGKTMVFESPRSTSAFLAPRIELHHHGITLTELQDKESNCPPVQTCYLFCKSELNQAYWVQRGIADAGAFNNGDWEKVPEKVRESLKQIHQTRPILRWLLSFHQSVSNQARGQLSRILTELHQTPAGQQALKPTLIAKFEELSLDDEANLMYWQQAQEAFESEQWIKAGP